MAEGRFGTTEGGETLEKGPGPQIGLRCKIYTASKTRHAPLWRRIREELAQEGHDVVSTWIDYEGPETVYSWEKLWVDCIQEASTADYLIVYLERGDELRGAYVEMGCALGQGVKVLLVNPDKVVVTDAVHHPLVTEVESLEAALAWITECCADPDV